MLNLTRRNLFEPYFLGEWNTSRIVVWLFALVVLLGLVVLLAIVVAGFRMA